MADEVKPPVAIRITRPYQTEDEFLEREFDTLTRTSVVLLGAQPRPQGVILRFEIVLKSGMSVLRGEGRVVAYKQIAYGGEPGLTLRFTRLDSRSKTVVDQAASLREARIRASAMPDPRKSIQMAAVQIPRPPIFTQPLMEARAPEPPEPPRRSTRPPPLPPQAQSQAQTSEQPKPPSRRSMPPPLPSPFEVPPLPGANEDYESTQVEPLQALLERPARRQPSMPPPLPPSAFEAPRYPSPLPLEPTSEQPFPLTRPSAPPPPLPDEITTVAERMSPPPVPAIFSAPESSPRESAAEIEVEVDLSETNAELDELLASEPPPPPEATDAMAPVPEAAAHAMVDVAPMAPMPESIAPAAEPPVAYPAPEAPVARPEPPPLPRPRTRPPEPPPSPSRPREPAARSASGSRAVAAPPERAALLERLRARARDLPEARVREILARPR